MLRQPTRLLSIESCAAGYSMIQMTNSESNRVVSTGVFLVAIILHLVAYPVDVFAQTSLPDPSTYFLTHAEQASGTTHISQQSKSQFERTREAKPELILQTAENSF